MILTVFFLEIRSKICFGNEMLLTVGMVRGAGLCQFLKLETEIPKIRLHVYVHAKEKGVMKCRNQNLINVLCTCMLHHFRIRLHMFCGFIARTDR